MKVKRHNPPDEDGGIDVTPMLDVVFILSLIHI